ncbi:E domain-containing protein [Staphylococcus aureus]
MTTPTLKNPLTGEIISKGESKEEITKDPINELTEYGPETITPGHRDEFDPKLPTGERKRKFQVNQELRIQKQEM